MIEEIEHLIDGFLDNLNDAKREYWYAKHSKTSNHNTCYMYHIESALNHINEMKKADQLILGTMKEYKGSEVTKDILGEYLYKSYIYEAEKLEKDLHELKAN